MGKLTAELIQRAPKFVNTFKERELDLRGNKIPEIENLVATEDQFDVLDLSDNEITKLENFPFMPHLKSILLNNNKINKIVSGLGESLPNLETLVLTNNRLQDLADVEAIGELKSLEMLSLVSNLIQKKPNYRQYLIWRLPNLRILDFRKERAAANKMFEGAQGEALLKSLLQQKTTAAEQQQHQSQSSSSATDGPVGLTPEQKEKIMEALKAATTTAEIDRLEQALQTGKMPKELL